MKKCAFVFLLMFSAFGVFAQSGFRVIKSFPVPGEGGWDYISVGPIRDRLYISHTNRVNIINKNSGDSVGVILNTVGVHGIAFDRADHKGFTSNGRANTVTVFDLKTNATLATIRAGVNPDAIMFDEFTKRAITCNGRGRDLSVIDPSTNMVVDSIPVGGKPETAVTDNHGNWYVNIEDKNEIVHIDAVQHKVMERWHLSPAEGPSGLAIDVMTHRLFAGCDNELVVMDALTGKIIQRLPIGEGCDGTAFDAKLKNVYASNGDGTLTVIHEDSADKFTVVENVKTQRSARTLAVDPRTHHVYLPAAEFEAAEPNQKGRPKIKPGSFHILVVGK